MDACRKNNYDTPYVSNINYPFNSARINVNPTTYSQPKPSDIHDAYNNYAKFNSPNQYLDFYGFRCFQTNEFYNPKCDM